MDLLTLILCNREHFLAWSPEVFENEAILFLVKNFG
jgi:hypothetical protein